MIADVAFDAPVEHPFSYRIPPGRSPSRAASACSPRCAGPVASAIVSRSATGTIAASRPLLAVRRARAAAHAEPARPGAAGVDRARIALLTRLDVRRAAAAAADERAGRAVERPTESRERRRRRATRPRRRAADRRRARAPPARAREPRVERAGRGPRRRGRGALGAAPGAARTRGRGSTPAWTKPRGPRRGRRLGGGGARLAVGTRSALLAPLASPARCWRWSTSTKPRTSRPARRDCTRARSCSSARGRERLAVALTAATPSVELWWRATDRARRSRWRRRRPDRGRR